MWNAHCDIFGRIDKLSKNEINNPIRMQGQYEDEETGLYYNRFRYYDPVISAYISQDPLGLGAGENVYSYVKNSFGWIDPLGLNCKKTKKITYEAESRRDADIPNNQKPSKVERVDLEDGYGGKVRNSDGTAVQTRNYHYTNNKGKEIVIQEHSLGHDKATPLHGQDPHFNVRPIENVKTGYVEGTHGHYNF